MEISRQHELGEPDFVLLVYWRADRPLVTQHSSNFDAIRGSRRFIQPRAELFRVSRETHPARSNGISILRFGIGNSGLPQSLTQAEGGAWRKMTNSPYHGAVKFTAH